MWKPKGYHQNVVFANNVVEVVKIENVNIGAVDF